MKKAVTVTMTFVGTTKKMQIYNRWEIKNVTSTVSIFALFHNTKEMLHKATPPFVVNDFKYPMFRA